MRPIEKGLWPTKGVRVLKKRNFNDWSRAIPHLKARTGKFCHFCEMRVTNALAIEHIKPKMHFPKLTSHWDNFLLICSYCNSHKKSRIPLSPYRTKYFWPHLNNTLIVFDFNSMGIIIPNAHLNVRNTQRAINTIELYGLDKISTYTGESDDRLIERLEAYKFAIDTLLEYQSGGISSIQTIVNLAESKGFFSVWLKVFDGVPAVRSALINCPNFHLLLTNCFDVALGLKARSLTDI